MEKEINYMQLLEFYVLRAQPNEKQKYRGGRDN